ncbi:MAG TPA: GAF domain-containing protein [Oscillatoriaceae cyanobacterium M33_DOE_052]|uniref:histidine kinase n=1 Tax=Planktothricoides sp. SpSt-374 TaxID=2282167 RepID=A0A7C3ZV88_9CYAN|nr:GAF domain-containing protein [Oscillatoriaceae cyanobacterium M33_DOE_052]
MSIYTSVLEDLLRAEPKLRTQVYFKSSLVALSHAMEDQVLAAPEGGTLGDEDMPLVIACFQKERFYRQEAHRYRRIGEKSDQVYVLAAPETEFKNSSDVLEMVAFSPDDALAREWHLVAIGSNYAMCLVCQEKEEEKPLPEHLAMDQARRFEGIWTFERPVVNRAASLLLDQIMAYRPELTAKVKQGKAMLAAGQKNPLVADPAPFADRLVTYLQASQYKLMKTYRSLADQERRERLVNSIASSLRRSLEPVEIFQVATRELGIATGACRCLIYRCKETDESAIIEHQYLANGISSLAGQTWPLKDHPLFQEVLHSRESAWTGEAETDPRLKTPAMKRAITRWHIGSWLLVPVMYQTQVVGIVELHHCGGCPRDWVEEERRMVEAIASQIGVALIQAEAYTHLEELNHQLEALERTRSNLIAITGHELRTPLSTIQICLESLATDPDMPAELRQIMLSTALADADRLRKLVQDFLTLSHLESGRVQWHLETLSLLECVEVALSSIRARQASADLPHLEIQMPEDLPFARADGEWLVEVLSKLLDNSCKFTPPTGTITITATALDDGNIEIIVADTGRGIPSDRLETVFDRFYQEEGALRRTTGGTGLGLAICRQIVTGWGGRIWATSSGINQGTGFHFTIPAAKDSQNLSLEPPGANPAKKRSRNANSGNTTRQSRSRQIRKSPS